MKCPDCHGSGSQGGGKWFRPGPIAEARILGRRPSAGVYGVWSEAIWQLALRPAGLPDSSVMPEIGCDVARYGDDWTSIVIRCGAVALHHETHNGWGVMETSGHLGHLARQWAQWATQRQERQAAPISSEQIPIKVDDDGVGGGVVDALRSWEKYWVVPVNGGSIPNRQDDYPNRRSELWFATAKLAKEGGVSLARLDRGTLAKLRQQALAPTWTPDAKGRRVVEPKLKTKEKLRRSPDDMDSLNLCYSYSPVLAIPNVPPQRARPAMDPDQWREEESLAAKWGLRAH